MTEITGETVWVLSHGEYSDYRVMCACPSKDAAELLAARFNSTTSSYDSASVEELPICGPDTQQVEILHVTANLWDNGKESETKTSIRTVWPFADFAGMPSAVSWRWVRAPVHNSAGGRLDVEGVDHERVRKVFGERRAQILADETGQLRKAGERTGGA